MPVSRLRMAASAAAALAATALAAHPALAAAAAPPPPPKIDTGDTAWMLTSTALVLLMTVPGLALFYAGMVRKKNVLATLMQAFAICCLVSIVWTVVGYSLTFTTGLALYRRPVARHAERHRRQHFQGQRHRLHPWASAPRTPRSRPFPRPCT